MVAYGLDQVDPDKDIRIILVEGAGPILPGLPERISTATLAILKKLGVDVRTSARVSAVRADGIELASGEFVPARAGRLGGRREGAGRTRQITARLEVNRANQLVTEATLRTTRDPDIFAIGDCAAVPREGFDAPVPPRAQAAHQEASHLAKQLSRRLQGVPMEPYVYRDFGSLVSFGRMGAIGNLMNLAFGGRLFVEGVLARWMYRSLYKMHERALHGVAKTALDTLARGLSRHAEPKVKLHSGGRLSRSHAWEELEGLAARHFRARHSPDCCTRLISLLAPCYPPHMGCFQSTSIISGLCMLLLRLDPRREPVFCHAALTTASPQIRSSLFVAGLRLSGLVAQKAFDRPINAAS